MASMFPACFTNQSPNSGVVGERIVYEFLRDNLPDDWIVIHDLWRYFFQHNRKQYANYETDFIVLVPNKGLLVIEVKNVRTLWVESGQWMFLDEQGREKPLGSYISPVQQAYLGSKRLMDCLSYRFDVNHVEFRSLAILLQQRRDDVGLPQGLDDMMVFGIEEMQDNLQQRIESLFINGHAFAREQMEAIRAYLVQTIQYEKNLRSHASMLDMASETLTRTLYLLENSTGGIRVDGCAGSGKTLMAASEVKRIGKRILQNEGQERILLLCFNRHLAHNLREQKSIYKLRQADIVYANTFARFCDDVLTPLNLTIDWRKAESEVAAYTRQLREQIAQNWQFDYVFVDEAQDFHPSWWPLVKQALRPNGKLYLFTDTNQSLYGHKNTVPEPPTRITLHHNIRNSKDIATYSHTLLPPGTTVYALPLNSQKVHILPGSDNVDTRAAKASKLVSELLQTYSARDIVVLSPWKKAEKSSLCRIPGVAGAQPGEQPEQSLARHERWHRNEHVLGESIRAFKGLESLIVILTDIPALGETPAFSLNDFYVACTRARVALYIIPTLTGEPFVREVQRRSAAPETAPGDFTRFT